MPQLVPREIQYILKIKWDRVNEITYTRDDISTLGNLSIEESNIVGFAGGLSVTLDDSSGALYALFRATDFHKVPANLYKLEESVESLVFAGEVTSPITWSENSREVNLTIDTKIEDREVGFSLEESIVGCAKKSIGQPWPLCFGNVLHVPAARIVETRTGVLMERFGFIDPMLAPSIQATLNAYYQELYIMRFSQQQLEIIGNLAPNVLTIRNTYIGALARRRLLHEARDLKVAIGKGEINRADIAGAVARVNEILELVFGDDPEAVSE